MNLHNPSNPVKIVILTRATRCVTQWRVSGMMYDDSLPANDLKREKAGTLRKVLVPNDVLLLDIWGAQFWIDGGQPRPFKQHLTREQFSRHLTREQFSRTHYHSIRGAYFWLGRVSDEPAPFVDPSFAPEQQ